MTRTSKGPSEQVKNLIGQVRTAAKRIGYAPGKRGQLNRLARELDTKKIAPAEGGTWILDREGHGASAQRLSKFLKKHAPDLHPDTKNLKKPSAPRASVPAPRSPDVTQSSTSELPGADHEPSVFASDTEPLQEHVSAGSKETTKSVRPTESVSHEEHTAPHFDEATISTLMEVAEWWRSKKQEPVSLREEAPKFRRFPAAQTVTRSIRLPAKLLKAAEARAKKERARTGGSLNSLITLLLWDFCGRPAGFVEDTDQAETEAGK